MKNYLKITVAAACAAMISFSTLARIPPDGDCDAWWSMYQTCQANGHNFLGGFTCSELYENWCDCYLSHGVSSQVVAIKQ